MIHEVSVDCTHQRGYVLEVTMEMDCVLITLASHSFVGGSRKLELRHPIQFKAGDVLVCDFVKMLAWRKKAKRATLTKIDETGGVG